MGKHFKPKNKKIVVLSALRIIFCITLIISIFYIIKWYIYNRQNELIEEKVSEAIIDKEMENEENTDTKYKVDFEQLKQMNNQIVAWLKVNGTKVEYPVVQAEDNDYYLDHNLDKKYNVGGWVFADYRNKLDGTDRNIIIYGHNMKDGSMFGTLKSILTEEWYNNEQNYIIDLITEKEEQEYEVFSVYQIKSEDYYIKTNFENYDFEKFVEKLKDRSIKDFDVEVTSEDSILTLSTCGSNNTRVVLHAKKR